MKYRVSELEGALLDAAVAVASGFDLVMRAGCWWVESKDKSEEGGLIGYIESGVPPWFHPSSDWATGGPIIEREKLMIQPRLVRGEWFGEWRSVCLSWEDRQHADEVGITPLIAAMRAYVTAKLGDEVELPEAPE